MIPEYDKYAPYIWVCFGLSVAALIVLAIVTVVRSRRAASELARLDAQRGGARR